MKVAFVSAVIGGFGGSGIYRWIAGPEWSVSGNRAGDMALLMLIIAGSVLVVRNLFGRLARERG